MIWVRKCLSFPWIGYDKSWDGNDVPSLWNDVKDKSCMHIVFQWTLNWMQCIASWENYVENSSKRERESNSMWCK